MIFYSGFGGLVALIILIGFMIPVGIEVWVKRAFNYELPNLVFLVTVTIIPFVGIQVLDYILRKWGPIERIKGRQGKIVEISARHTFMFLPISWCAYAWLIFMGILNIWILFSRQLPRLRDVAIN